MKNRQKLPIRFWHGMNLEKVFDELTPADKKQLNRLMAGDENNELNLEQLRNSSVYSIRVNSGRRILFTTVEGKSKNNRIALILEILPTHDYTNAKCLQPRVLKQFLKRADIDQLVFDAVKTVEGLEKNAIEADGDNDIELDLIEYDYYQGRGITLTDEQKNIQHYLEMPCFIQGMAGSGKTSVINAIIIDRIEQHTVFETVPERPIVYITESQRLAEAQRAQWAQHPLSNTPAGQQVLFLTTSQATATYSTAVRVEHRREIANSELVKRVQAKVKSLSFSKFDTESNVDKLMHEFEIIAACRSAKDYFSLGQHQSNYNNNGDRKLLWHASEEVKATLATDGLYSPRFYCEKPGNLEKQCSLVIIDEAHSGPRVVKLNFRRLSEDFIGCVDSLQSMNKIISDVPYLIEHTGKNKTMPANVYRLNQSFRNPARVIYLANGLNRLRRFALGGKGDKTEQTEFDNAAVNTSNIGTVVFVENKNVDHFFEAINTDRADFAIVTTDTNKEKAKLKYNNPQVFTAPEIGGLEYDNIIIDNLFDKAILAKLNETLGTYTPTSKVSVNRPKEVSEHTDTNSFFNTLNTAFTRPRKRLYIVDAASERNTRAFYEHIQGYIDAANLTYQTEEETEHLGATSTPEEWTARVEALVATGQLAMAEDIWLNRLKRTQAAFDEKYRQTSDHENIVLKLDEDLECPTFNQLKSMLNKQDYKHRFLAYSKGKSCLMLKLLYTSEGQDSLLKLMKYNSEKMGLLFSELLDFELKFLIEGEEAQDIFLWLMVDVSRRRIINMLATRYAKFSRKLIDVLESRCKEMASVSLGDGSSAKLPIAMIAGIVSTYLFKKLFLQNPALVKSVMKEYWFYTIKTSNYREGAPFIVFLADYTENDDIAYLDAVELPIENFIDANGNINVITVNALLAGAAGVHLLYQHAYLRASPVQAARLSCDEFMFEGINSDFHDSKGTRFDYLVSYYSVSKEWVKTYLICHPKRLEFLTTMVPAANNNTVVAHAARLFENHVFTLMIMEMAKSEPEDVKAIFKDFNFHFSMPDKRYFLQYLIELVVELADNRKIIGIEFFERLLTIFKADLFPLENLGELMKGLMAVRSYSPKTSITGFAYLARSNPGALVTLLRYYPSLVHFITPDDLISFHYCANQSCLINLLMTCAINGNKFLLLYSLLSASDYHLLRTVPIYAWLKKTFVDELCVNPLGEKLLLKLVELSSRETLITYNNNSPGQIMLLNSSDKTRNLFMAIIKKMSMNAAAPMKAETPIAPIKPIIDEPKAMTPRLVELVSQPFEEEFKTRDECERKIVTAGFRLFQPDYRPDNQTLTCIRQIVNLGKIERLIDLYQHPSIISILLHKPLSTNIRIEQNLFCTLMQDKTSRLIVDYFDKNTEIMYCFLNVINFQTLMTSNNKMTSYQQFLFTTEGCIKLVACYATHFPGHLKNIPSFDKDFKAFIPREFEKLFAHCNSVTKELFLKEFPALRSVKQSEKETTVAENASSYFTASAQVKKHNKPRNNKKRQMKKK